MADDSLVRFGTSDTGPAFWDPEDALAVDREGRAVLYGEGPTFMNNPWDVVFLDGKPLPGICKVECEPELQIDQKKGPGIDGARLRIHGFLPGPVVISTTIWTHDQWNAFNDMRPGLIRAPGKKDAAVASLAASLKISEHDAQNYVAAVSVGHPWFESNDVNAVIIRGISLDDGPQPQTKTIRLKCQQFMPPVLASATKPAKGDRRNVGQDGRTKPPPHVTSVGPGGADHSRY